MLIQTCMLALLVAGTFSLPPALARDDSSAECRPGGTQADLNQCASARLKKSDAELNRLYKSQMSYLGAESRQRLQAAQRAWIAYRDATCLYENGPREESGSIWPMQEALCRARMTRERNASLSAYAACRADGCPN